MTRPTRNEIIDLIVREATANPVFVGFLGDKRDGQAPPITVENFSTEAQRHGAKALRARLSRLPRAELDAELRAAAAYFARIPTLEESVRVATENEARELSNRQSERARKLGYSRRSLKRHDTIERRGKRPRRHGAPSRRHRTPPKMMKVSWSKLSRCACARKVEFKKETTSNSPSGGKAIGDKLSPECRLSPAGATPSLSAQPG
jgi:hypothetical protein